MTTSLLLPSPTLRILCWMVGLLAQQPADPASAPDDDFAPLLLPMMLIALAICLVLIGVGLALALVGFACAAVLVALGIVSSSAVVAVLRRRVTAGVRVFHYQICAAVGVPGGITLLWAVTALFHLELRLRSVVLFGAAAGFAAGLVLAAALDLAARLMYRRLLPVRGSDAALPTASLPG